MLDAMFDAGMTLARFQHDEEMQDDAQTFNFQEAERNRKFQTDMSNTAYQRAMKDMSAAGLNPMLAAHFGGASTPQGAQAHSGIASGGGAGRAISFSQAQLNSAVVAKTEAEAERAEAETDEIRARTPTHGVSIDRMRQEIKESEERIDKIMAEVNLIRAQERHTASGQANVEQHTRNLKAMVEQINGTVGLLRAQVMESAQRTATGRAEEQKVWNEAKANLPEMERILKDLQAKIKHLELPGKMNDAGFEETLGSLQRLKRLLPWPFNN